MTRPITKLLIANRGEIARRIMRTAHAMGIATVAVYADGDALEPFVREADEAMALGGSSAADTYLDQTKVLAAANATNADAVHPGYGFLAENAGFAEAVIEAGLTWVGPPPNAIAAMGDKLSAKRLMEGAGVPGLPSAELKPGEDVSAAARKIGYSVLVKASAGGGGKGMRVVRTEGDLEQAVASARREAGAAFGDDTVFLERWLEGARHIEVQVVGDIHGAVVHCFERECSIQRRHQKIIEEAPSPAVDNALRRRMGDAAVSAAKAIGYHSTGTFEFLVEDDAFWFLEMNTRLQVEHPVTEAITGLDLVREQLRIAQGETLGYGQDDLCINGHAIEARLCAEDPANDFLPATGSVLAWQPATSSQARFDSGIETGSIVGIDFDSMLAKVITHAPNRREAALALARALEQTRVQGIATNRDFLAEILRTPEFLAGDTTTDFVDRVAPRRHRHVPPEVRAHAAIAIALAGQCDARARAGTLATLPSGWRNTRMPPQQISLRHLDEDMLVAYRCQRDGSFRCWLGEEEFHARILRRSAGAIELEVDGRHTEACLTRDGERWFVQAASFDLEFTERSKFPNLEQSGVHGGLTAPMPGKVVSTHAKAGDEVEAGDLLVVLEAMKMELRITAPIAGRISEMHVEAEQQVANGELLVVVADLA